MVYLNDDSEIPLLSLEEIRFRVANTVKSESGPGRPGLSIKLVEKYLGYPATEMRKFLNSPENSRWRPMYKPDQLKLSKFFYMWDRGLLKVEKFERYKRIVVVPAAEAVPPTKKPFCQIDIMAGKLTVR